MTEKTDVTGKLARLKAATDGLRPSEAALVRLGAAVAAGRRDPPAWLVIAARSRTLAIAAVALCLVALLAGWQVRRGLEASLLRAAVALGGEAP